MVIKRSNAAAAAGDQPNKTLKGHKLIILSAQPADGPLVSAVRTRFPDLEIIVRNRAWANIDAKDGISDEDWQTATVLLTGSAVPEPEDARRLRLVQLQSAGANHMLDKRLFKDTDVVFCTANGVHG